LVFSSKDGSTTRDLSLDGTYGNRILFLEHVEEVYNDYAVILLRNNDKALPSVEGYWTEIGYGDTTSGGNEYAGDGANGGAKASSRLWVKSQQNVSAAGKLYTILELEGVWSRFREVMLRLGNAPKWQRVYEGTTVYDRIEALIEAEMSWTLDPLGAQDDSIIDTLSLNFDVNDQGTFEFMAGMLYRLIRLTKTFIRSRAGNNFEIRYPQSADSVDLAFSSDSAPQFYSYTDRSIIHIPNRVLVYANAGLDGLWHESTFVTGDAADSTSVGAYSEIAALFLAPDVGTEADADLIAAALLSKIKAESVVGIGLVPHHCAVELLDKLTFTDNRVSQNVYPSDGTVRVGGLKHTYRPGYYRLQITLGGQSVTGDVARAAGAAHIVFTDFEESAITPPVDVLAGMFPGQVGSQLVQQHPHPQFRLDPTQQVPASPPVIRPSTVPVPLPLGMYSESQLEKAELFGIGTGDTPPPGVHVDIPTILRRDDPSGLFTEMEDIMPGGLPPTDPYYKRLQESILNPPEPEPEPEPGDRSYPLPVTEAIEFPNFIVRLFRRIF
tara:strand:- start:36663 stop:38318 length:1656 start_codon:yes stop_codon:yes gene_type:complete